MTKEEIEEVFQQVLKEHLHDPEPISYHFGKAIESRAERDALERAAEICDEAWKFEQDAGIADNAIRALIEQDKKETK